MLSDAHVYAVYFPGCPGAKKTEFLTSVLDALSTDMVHAVTDPASAGRYEVHVFIFELLALNLSPRRHKRKNHVGKVIV